jgi:hypothetical protein
MPETTLSPEEREARKKERELKHQIEINQQRRWGSLRTWVYIALMGIGVLLACLLFWLIVGQGILATWNLGHPGTRPG